MRNITHKRALRGVLWATTYFFVFFVKILYSQIGAVMHKSVLMPQKPKCALTRFLAVEKQIEVSGNKIGKKENLESQV